MDNENPLCKPPPHEDFGEPPPPYSEAAPAAYYYPQQQQVSLVVIPVREGGFQSVSVVNSVTNNNFRVVTPSETNSNLPCAATIIGGQRIFSDISKRQVFVRKVYGIVSAQLVTLISFMTVFMLNPTWWRHIEPGLHLAFAMFLAFPLFIIIGCCACYCSMPRKSPGNIVCLVLHTLALAFIFVIISAATNDRILLTAVVVSAIACVSLTIFATKFATCGGILLATGIVLVSFAILMAFLRDLFPIPYLVCGCVGALVFSTFLVYDTQLMVMGKHRQRASISWNDYVFAVHTFHMDIMCVWFCYCPRKCW